MLLVEHVWARDLAAAIESTGGGILAQGLLGPDDVAAIVAGSRRTEGSKIPTMTSDQTFVIVGACLAGAKAAETLRSEGFEGRLVLIGSEAERPYERPPLSKDYLRGELEREKVYVHPEGFYAEQDIELRRGRTAVRWTPRRTSSSLDDGERLRYDRLLLATGAEPRKLSIPGADLDGVLYLRSVEDSDALRERLDRGGAVVVIGAGWIGAEVAACARQRGLEVTVIDPLSVPLERSWASRSARIYRDVHAEHGVTMLMQAQVEASRARAPSSACAPATVGRSSATSSSSASACSRGPSSPPTPA